MKYEIWQAPSSAKFKFMHYDWIEGNKPTICDYVMVYSGETEIEDDILESLWEMFNVNPPGDYHGMSLSVSDVICLIDRYNKRRWWYVDGIGFHNLNWEV